MNTQREWVYTKQRMIQNDIDELRMLLDCEWDDRSFSDDIKQHLQNQLDQKLALLKNNK